MTKSTRRAMCNKGIIAIKMAFNTTCKPEKERKICFVIDVNVVITYLNTYYKDKEKKDIVTPLPEGILENTI